jgi:hypothetical protein
MQRLFLLRNIETQRTRPGVAFNPVQTSLLSDGAGVGLGAGGVGSEEEGHQAAAAAGAAARAEELEREDVRAVQAAIAQSLTSAEEWVAERVGEADLAEVAMRSLQEAAESKSKQA